MRTLVRTPRPYRTESLCSYVLRVAEANGYDSPRIVLQLAGIAVGNHTATRLPTDKLERILGFEPGALAEISNSGTMNNRTPEFAILGHVSGFSYRNSQLRMARPAFCPLCVKHNGYVDACWDVRLMPACPFHRCELLSACASCTEPLRWDRQGVLRCHCGADLHGMALAPVEDDISEFLTLLWMKIHSEPLSQYRNPYRFPVTELEALPLWRLFFLMQRLSEHNLISRGLAEDTQPLTIVRNVAEVLKEWPLGYRSFLQRVGDQSGALGLNVVGINARFKHFYSALFKCYGYRGEFDFCFRPCNTGPSASLS